MQQKRLFLELGKTRAFTLIEVLVTATIIAVLTSIGVVSYRRANINSRNARRKADLEQIRSALEMYRADNDAYPTAATCTRVNDSLIPTDYMADFPSDPKNDTAYRYIATSDGYCVSAEMEGSTPDGSTCDSGNLCDCDGDGDVTNGWGLKAP